jgi:hypothetical protein
MTQVRIRIGGTGQVVHTCDLCKRPITDEPMFLTIDGRPVALLRAHKEPVTWPQTHA